MEGNVIMSAASRAIGTSRRVPAINQLPPPGAGDLARKEEEKSFKAEEKRERERDRRYLNDLVNLVEAR